MEEKNPVEIATLFPGAIPVTKKEKGKNQTYTGRVAIESETIACYIKFIDGRKLFVETLAAKICEALQVPVVETFIALVDDDTRPLDVDKSKALALATRNSGYKSCASRVSLTSPKLKQWKQLNNLVLLDEYIANADRHPGNLLYDGNEGFLAIDHDLAMPQRYPPNIPAMLNQIFSSHIHGNDKNKNSLDKFMRKGSALFGNAKPVELIDLVHGPDYVTQGIIDEIVNFLIARTVHVPVILDERMKSDQRQLKLQ